MNDVETGEYVRTYNKGIKKIDHLAMNKTVNKYRYFIGYEDGDRCYGVIKTTEVLKHSKNIIDLIEVGDYINGELIDFISMSKEGKKRPLIRDNVYFFDKYNSIKSIVTKEQFAQMEYKLGG